MCAMFARRARVRNHGWQVIEYSYQQRAAPPITTLTRVRRGSFFLVRHLAPWQMMLDFEGAEADYLEAAKMGSYCACVPSSLYI